MTKFTRRIIMFMTGATIIIPWMFPGTARSAAPRRRPLPITALTREMLRLTRMHLPQTIEFVASRHDRMTPDERPLQLRHVDILIKPERLEISFEDFSEWHLHPMAKALANALSMAGINQCFELPIPPMSAAVSRYDFDGLAMRGRIEESPPISDPDGELPPIVGAMMLRFDVLFAGHA